MNLTELARQIVADCVPAALVTDTDRAVIAANADWLLSLEDLLTTAFYDTLYAHPNTAAVFVPGERPDREQTLRIWWRRTVTSGLGDDYLEWMALVGLAHIRRKVKNPMMISMFQVVTTMVTELAIDDLGPDTGRQIGTALGHLQATVSALISETFTKGYIGALQDLAGLNPALTERMLTIEISDMEAAERARFQ